MQKRNLNRLLKMAAWVSLIAAYIFGHFLKQEDYFSLAEEQVVEKNLEVTGVNSDVMTIKNLQHETLSRIRFGQGQGYGGDLTVGVIYNEKGSIEDILLLADRETVSFINKLIRKGFFGQFPDKAVNDPLHLGTDIDAVSGCTVSSLALTNAIREAGFQAARKDFDLEVKEPPVYWKVGFDEIAVLVLIVMGILAIYLKKKWLRYVSLGVSLALLGFYLNASISISHFARLTLGFLPTLKEHFIWWALVLVALAFPFFLRKNLYCYALCPFHAVQTLLIKISGFSLKLTGSFLKFAKTASTTLLWLAFMVIFLSENPTLGSYEPFALLFSLDGAGLQWYLLPAALFGALLVPDFYCRYFCPVGRALSMLGKFGDKTRKISLRSLKPELLKKTG